MAKKLGVSNVNNLNVGNVNVQSIKQVFVYPKYSSVISKLKKYKPPPIPPDDYSKLYEGPDPVLINENFKWLSDTGIGAYRPEILALTNFQPAYNDQNLANKGSSLKNESVVISNPFGNPFGELSAVGKMLNVQVWAKELIKDNMIELVKTLKTYPELTKQLSDRENDFLDQFKQASSDTEFLLSLVLNLEKLKRSFNILRALTVGINDSSQFSTQQKNIGDNDISPIVILSKHLGFNSENIKEFSNTKVLQQMCFDLYRIINKYSYTLFGATNQNRKSDNDPIIINRVVDISPVTLKFNASSLSSIPNSSINATDSIFHKQFDNSLPTNYIDRAKLLLTFLSKEFRVSVGLGDQQTVTSIASRYPAISNVGDPFRSIIGVIGYDITDKSVGAEQSLSNVTQFSVENDRLVLPFENLYVDATNNSTRFKRTYIPGTSYFVDPIITSTSGQFDTSILQQVSGRVNRNINSAIESIGRLLQLSDIVNDPGDLFENSISLRGVAITTFSSLYDQLFSMRPKQTNPSETFNVPIAGAGSGIPQPTTANPDVKHQVFKEIGLTGMLIGSLIVQASEDFAFKNLLFRYTMLSGIVANNEGARKGSFFVDVTNEIGVELQNAKVELHSIVEELLDRLFALYGGNLQGTIFSNMLGKEPTNLYKEPKYKSYSIGRHELRWTLLSLATSSTAHIPQFKNTWMSNYENVLNSYNDLLNKASAKLNGLTRYNSLSNSTIALVLFESFVALMSKNSLAFFAKGFNEGTLQTVVDVEKQSQLINVANILKTKASSQSSAIKQTKMSQYAQSKFFELSGLLDGILLESDAIVSILRMFDALNKGIQLSTKETIEKFSKNSVNEKKFKQIQGITTSGSPVLLDKSQIILTRALLDEMKERIGTQLLKSDNQPNTSQVKVDSSFFLDDDSLSQGMINAMFSMLREPSLRGREADTSRIMTVGIPAGFSSGLFRKVNSKKNVGNVFRQRQDDIVTINVFKQDEQYDGIVFKPKQFLFELSRFVITTANPNIVNTETLASTLSKLKYADYSIELFSLDNDPKPSGAEEIFTNPAYSFLSVQEKESLRKNHAFSALLGIYIKLLTGLSFNEKTFVTNADEIFALKAESSGFMQEMATVHVSKTAGVPIVLDDDLGDLIFSGDTVAIKQNLAFDETQKILDIPGAAGGISEKLTEDLRMFGKIFASTTMHSDGSIERAKLLTPKYFERVFNLIFDANDFEIDISKSDSEMIDILTKQGVITPRTNDSTVIKMVSRNVNDGHAMFEKYFVTIDSMNEINT